MPIYLEIPNFNGGSTLKVQLLSCQFGVNRNIRAPVGQSSRREETGPSLTEIVVTREYDKYSPLFYQEAVIGRGRSMTVYFVDSKANKTYLTVILENAMVSSYHTSGGGDKLVESFSVNFTKVTTKYDPGVSGSNPSMTVGWDLVSITSNSAY